jgi:hypothetical protein
MFPLQYLIFFFFLVVVLGFFTQGLTLARQVLYHLIHSASSQYLILIESSLFVLA